MGSMIIKRDMSCQHAVGWAKRSVPTASATVGTLRFAHPTAYWHDIFRSVRNVLLGLFIIFCINACGFHLRGDIPLAEPLKRLSIQSQDPYGQLVRDLEKYFRMSGVVIVKHPCDATTILVINREVEAQHMLSVGGSQQTRQYQLTLAVTFEVTDPSGRVLVPCQDVLEQRVLAVQANQVLGGSNEANNLYQQMRRAIVYDIMMRLSSARTTDLLMRCPA